MFRTPTVTVQATVQLDRRLYEDARTYYNMSTTRRLMLGLIAPDRLLRLENAARMVDPAVATAPRFVPAQAPQDTAPSVLRAMGWRK